MAIYQLIRAEAERNPRRDEIAQLYEIAGEVLDWQEPRALAGLPADTRRLVEAWAKAGRPGAAAAALVERKVTPRRLVQALGASGLDENHLLKWLGSLTEDDLSRNTVGFIVGWRAAGLPGDPPAGAARFRHRDPAELAAWLAAGFDLYAAAQLEPAGLDRGVRWKQAGFGPADTYELLRADPALTPEHALAFADLDPELRRHWVYLGFDAAEGAEWTQAGLGPYEAGLWRACGRHPADVQPGQRIPAELTEREPDCFSGHPLDGLETYRQWDELADPPGTPGRRARRRAGDPDPWINTD